MTNNKKYLQNYKNKITDKIFNDTEKYRQQYNLPVSDTEPGHNDTVDAFRHAYMSAYFSKNFGKPIAKFITDQHETEGNQRGQDPKESNMDLWNNAVGRKVASEVYKEYVNKGKTHEEIEDIISDKINTKIKQGELITNPNDPRKYTEPSLFDNIKSKFKGLTIGQAAPIDNSQHFTRQQIGAMTPDEFQKNESQIMEQLKNNQIQNKAPDISAFSNSFDNRIFTREDIGNMSTDEYNKHEKLIMNQMKSIGIPTNNEIKNNPGAVFIPAYTKADGTEVKGYYRKR